jgi:hypothetical protein
MNGSMGRTVTSGIAHNISSTEEKVNTLKSERSIDEDLSVLSIRSVSSAVGRTLLKISAIGNVQKSSHFGGKREGMKVIRHCPMMEKSLRNLLKISLQHSGASCVR